MKRACCLALPASRPPGRHSPTTRCAKLAFFSTTVAFPPVPDFERTSERAKADEWPSMAQDLALTFTPMENPEALQGMDCRRRRKRKLSCTGGLTGGNRPAGKIVEGCTVALDDVDAAMFEKRLGREGERSISAGEEQQEQDRVYKRYTA